MNLCVSNIAWKKEENDRALSILRNNSIFAIDIAPSLIFDSIENITETQIKKKFEEYKNIGFKIIAMQSLLYKIPAFSIFNGDKEREKIIKYLEKMIIIAKGLQIKILVFASPKNRFIKDETKNNLNIAVDFFRKICSIAERFKINICLEANPKEYECNFITNTFEAIDFIKKVNKKNFLLNLDTSTIILNNEDFEEVFSYSREYINHVHISSPYLKGIKDMDHNRISGLLKKEGYKGYISLEMKPGLTEDNLKNLEENVSIFLRYYR